MTLRKDDRTDKLPLWLRLNNMPTECPKPIQPVAAGSRAWDGYFDRYTAARDALLDAALGPDRRFHVPTTQTLEELRKDFERAEALLQAHAWNR